MNTVGSGCQAFPYLDVNCITTDNGIIDQLCRLLTDPDVQVCDYIPACSKIHLALLICRNQHAFLESNFMAYLKCILCESYS